MRSQLTAVVLVVLLLTGGVAGWTAVTLAVLLLEDSAGAQSAPPVPPAGKTMKNLQVLKDIPDSKKAKLTARSKMKMVREIDAANFDGRPVVTNVAEDPARFEPPASAPGK